jgi:hypothetical protein
MATLGKEAVQMKSVKETITFVFYLVLGFLSFQDFARGAIVTAGISRGCDLNALVKFPAIPPNQVQYLYCLLLGRAADANGLNFYTGQLTQKQITMTDLMNIMFRSAEFTSDYNTHILPPVQFVILVYTLLLFRAPDSAELTEYADKLTAGTLSRQDCFAIVVDTNEFRRKSIIMFSVDPSTLDHKMLFGYQGWFTTIQDGDPFSAANNSDSHWSQWGTGIMSPLNATVDMWPDTSAYPSKLLYPTAFTLPNGGTARVYSAWDSGTVNLHFQWMEQYGLDGGVLQEFVQNYLTDSKQLQSVIDTVALNVKAAAEASGRVFAVELDCSECTSSSVIQSVQTRWMHLVDSLQLIQSPAYLHHKGRPVVILYGFGRIDYPDAASPQQAAEIINWFHAEAPPQYRATIVGQTCVGWRTLGKGCLTDPLWASVYQSYDVIQPWYVGAWSTIPGADSKWNNVIKGDIDATTASGQGYMPTLWPGTSVSNLMRIRGESRPLNQVPRLGGQFWWHQLYNYLGNDPLHKITMAYGAMFDEVDEGTAMYKLAATVNDVPHQAPAGFVYLDMPDSYSPIGYSLPSDWYLELANCGTKALHGEFIPTDVIPASGRAPGCQ